MLRNKVHFMSWWWVKFFFDDCNRAEMKGEWVEHYNGFATKKPYCKNSWLCCGFLYRESKSVTVRWDDGNDDEGKRNKRKIIGFSCVAWREVEKIYDYIQAFVLCAFHFLFSSSFPFTLVYTINFQPKDTYPTRKIIVVHSLHSSLSQRRMMKPWESEWVAKSITTTIIIIIIMTQWCIHLFSFPYWLLDNSARSL